MLEYLKVLLTKNVNQRKEGDPPMVSRATLRGDKKLVELLLKKGAKLDIPDSEGRLPLHIAIEAGKDEIAKMLIEAGAKLEVLNNEKQTPLHLAAKTNNLEMVRTLTYLGAAVDIGDKSGWTPFHFAIDNKNLEMAKVLHQKGADVNRKEDIQGKTPLIIACLSGEEDLVRWLLDNDAKTNHRDKGGYMPLHVSAMKDFKNIVDMLLNAGADINAKETTYGRTPSQLASIEGHAELASFILQKGNRLRGR